MSPKEERARDQDQSQVQRRRAKGWGNLQREVTEYRLSEKKKAESTSAYAEVSAAGIVSGKIHAEAWTIREMGGESAL